MKVSLKFFSAYDVALRALILIAFLAVFSPCHAQLGALSSNKSDSDVLLLGLVGFNYTDRHISEYSVNGASGGHINLSSPTSGGSGVTCCVKLSKNHVGAIQVKVRWQVDGCKFVESNPRTGATVETRRFYYKETMVTVQTDVGKNLNFIETHFYPNSEVQVKLAEHGSNPSLVLNENRPDKSHFPKCKNGEISR